MANSYYPGDVVGLTATFTDEAGAAANPTVMTFCVRSAAGVVTAYVYGTDAIVTNPATGQFDMNFPVPRVTASVGTWYVSGVGTGANARVHPTSFEVLSDPTVTS